MTTLVKRTRADERGAALVLAIAFMVVIGAIAMATLSLITSGLNNRRTLDDVRDREYGADAAIEYAIAHVRTKDSPTGGPGIESCSAGLPASYSIGGANYHVDCQNALASTLDGFVQRNVIFIACKGTSTCTTSNEIIRAQVNFQAIGGGAAPVVVTRTWVQSWSVRS
jgi:Tfp pilus assembly protein PilX